MTEIRASLCRLLPGSWRGSLPRRLCNATFGDRLRESLLWVLRLHGDHEPKRAQRRVGVPPASAGRKPALPDRRDPSSVAVLRRVDASPAFRLRERKSLIISVLLALP